MEREAKAMVVVSVWGAEFIQFLATPAVVDLEEKFEFILNLPNRPRQNSLCGKEFIELFPPPPPKQTRRPLPLLLSPSFFYDIFY